ncbi:MAG: hypothetical protein E6G81_13575 [Alphaproteobacteria bacterium]|nr:MAG: hypothetical protein E6G81_13575 [Alphaproteobacteria bacterium]
MEDSPDISRAMRMTEPSGQPSAVRDPDLIREVSDWLIREGRFAGDNADLFARFCERLLALGVPLDRAYLHLRALHPQYRGVSRIWKPGEPLAERFIDYAIEKTATYIESPVRVVVEERQHLEWRLDNRSALPFAPRWASPTRWPGRPGVPAASPRLIFTCSLKFCRCTRHWSNPRRCGASRPTC